ncbi:MAG: hypothetical protein ACRDNZ_03465 [Streptosporangiaceae bacterium]
MVDVSDSSTLTVAVNPSESWYEVVKNSSLEQGDILIDVITPRALINPMGNPEIRIGVGSYVVLSQTCDLENDKVKEVLLANIVSYQALAHEIGASARSTKFRQALIQGSDIAYFLLHEFSGPPKLEWSVANFHQLRLADIAACRGHAGKSGQRLRLIPPYKENLAQCFGRYMMRVALPNTAREFKDFAYVPPPFSSGGC